MKQTKVTFLFFIILFSNPLLILSQNIKDKSSFDSIYKKVNYFSKSKENTKALIFSRKLLNIALTNNNEKQKVKSYFKIAEFHRKLNFKDSAFYYYNKSKYLFYKQNDSIQLGRTLFQLAIIESNFGSFSNSDSTFVQSLKYLNGKRINTIAAIYNSLAINSKRRFLYRDAIINYNKALSISKSQKSKIKYKNNIANVYKELKEYSKSILIFKALLKDSLVIRKTKARVSDNLAHTKWLQNSEVNVYKDLLLANSLKLKNNDDYGLIASYSHLSEYFNKKDKSKSLFYANKMYEISKQEKSPQDIIESIDKIVALQTPQKSIKYYQESIRLRDSLQKANMQRQYKFAKIKYNYEEEEKQKLKFKTLATENKLIAEQENNQKKNILLIGVIFTFGLLFLLYRRKQQQRKKVLEEKYLTEISIAKKIHDDLGNNIFNVITKVQNFDFKKNEILNDLDKLYLQTRAISHENDVIETGKEFENYFNQLIASYHSKDCKIILKDLSVLELNSLKREQQRVLYRVFNELLVNMKKHSKANLIVISCKKENKVLKINYADNGVGFKNNEVVLKNGLKNMETRIKSIKGTLIFESNKGCKIKIRFKK